jgi:hypothetical protein
MSESKTITKHDEVVVTSIEINDIKGKFLAERLLRSWNEDFVDKDTGEVISIERNEVIADRGSLINGDLLSRLLFHIQAGDVKEIKASNQRRVAQLYERSSLYPYTATVRIGDKKKKFILYAGSLRMATEIVADYVELNFVGMFEIIMVKEFTYAVLLKDNIQELGEEKVTIESWGEVKEREIEESTDLKFYEIDVTILTSDDESSSGSFVVETKDIDKALVVIRKYLDEKLSDRDYKVTELKLEQAKIVPCDMFIEREFSEAYINI